MDIKTTVYADDCVPLDFATMSAEAQQKIIASCRDHERQRLRAAALHERLAAWGLSAAADTLRIRDLVCNYGDDAQKLQAIEAIVSTLECGPGQALMQALHDGAGSTAALSLLQRIHNPAGAVATAERLAVLVLVKEDDATGGLSLSEDVRLALLDTIEGAAESLRNRLEIVEIAIERLCEADKPLN